MSASTGPKISISNNDIIFLVNPNNTKSYTPGSGLVYSRNIAGTLTNGATYSNGYFSLDGVNDYIDFGDNLNIDTTTNVTITAWVKLQNNSAFQQIVAKRESSGGFNGYELRCSTAGVLQLIYDGSVTSSNRLSTVSIYDNTWHFVCGVINMTGNQLLLYRDGILDTTGSSSGTPNSCGSSTNTISLCVGQRGGGYLLGSVGEVRMYNRVLNATEIYELYGKTKLNYGF